MRLLCLAATILFAIPAKAHEFWISPEQYMISPKDQLVANIRVGQDFGGPGYSFVPTKFVRFDLVMGDGVIAVTGKLGDRPALSMPINKEGLVVVVHQTTDLTLTYSDADKFLSFLQHKDFTGVLEEHQARGLPETGFRERYSRFGKSLIAVGAGAGADGPVGMETEIVALTNPYTDDLSDGVLVLALYQGQPRINTQVELFEKNPDGTVAVTKHRTDADGRVSLPVKAGHEYLADAVVMRALEPKAENDPVWESLWASLTFRVPAN